MNEEITERLERHRQGLPPKSTRKKFSGVIVIINIILLGVFLLIYKKTPAKNFSTTAVEYENMNYTIVMARNTKAEKHNLSVKLQSTSKVPRTFNYTSSIMQIVFQSEGQVIYRTDIGKNDTRLILKPYESRIIEETMDDIIMNDYIENHPQLLIPRRKTNLFNETQYLPLTAVIKINTEKPITLFVEMKYEIE